MGEELGRVTVVFVVRALMNTSDSHRPHVRSTGAIALRTLLYRPSHQLVVGQYYISKLR